MRKNIMILGTILIVAVILISGSAVGAYAGAVYSDVDCENSEDALWAEDGDCATVGTNNPDPTMGDLWLHFGHVGIPDVTYITVYGQGIAGEEEFYDVKIYNGDFSVFETLGNDQSDQYNNSFTTIAPMTGRWTFIRIIGTSGSTSIDDPIYGPEIDAVGF